MLEKLIPGLTPEEGQILKPYFKAKTAPVGSILIEYGQTDRDLYFLISGNYEIYRKVQYSNRLAALKVASLEAPLLLGEGNLLLQQERNATILVSRQAKYFMLEYDDFLKIRSEHPMIAIKLLEYAGHVMTKRFNELQNMVFTKLISNSPTLEIAKDKLKKFIASGDVVPCSPELAKKLFSITNYNPDLDKAEKEEQ
ncbi:MAG: cyclic nucleotide-binding domain-containing protein [Pseudomonadota bacterium]|nr:cyclic nucleotide-binding domain-containing protein [Pseudomonadota bacterium]